VIEVYCPACGRSTSPHEPHHCPAEPTGELREEIARWLWEAQPGSVPWPEISDFTQDGFRRLADAFLAGPLAPLLAKLRAVEELAARTRAYPPSAVPLGMLLRALDAS
jgi:hypothetical protein